MSFPLLPLLPLPPVPPYQLARAPHQHSPARCPILSPRGESQMISMTPEQAAFLLQYQLPSVKNEYRTTSAIIAATEHRFYNAVLTGTFDFNAIPRPEGGITKENILKWYADSFAKNFDNLTRLTREQAANIMDFRGLFH